MPPRSRKRKNDRNRRGTGLHVAVPTNIPEEVGGDEIEGERANGARVHDDGDEDDASPRSWNGKQTNPDGSNSITENHPRLPPGDSSGNTAPTAEVLEMDDKGEGNGGLEAAVVVAAWEFEEKNNGSLEGADQLEAGESKAKFVEPLKDSDKKNVCKSSSSDYGSSDSDGVKEMEKPGTNLDVPEVGELRNAVRTEVLEVEVPIENSETVVESGIGGNMANVASPALSSLAESVKEEIGERIDNYGLVNLVESVKEETTESIDDSSLVNLAESTREETTVVAVPFPSVEVHQEVEKQVVIVDTAGKPIDDPSKDNEKPEITGTKRILPPPIERWASWRSCCGLMDVFIRSNR